MACVMDPNIGPNGEYLKWEPTQIPSTKPFVNISTSAFCEDTFIYLLPLPPISSVCNFKVGYPKEAKWFETINDKWTDYANFFVGKFLEALFTQQTTKHMPKSTLNLSIIM